MPRYSNQFLNPSYVEQTIANADGSRRGTLRIKPCSVLWKPAGAHSFYSAPLAEFEKWLTSAPVARKVKH